MRSQTLVPKKIDKPEIQPGQWRDKGENIYSQDENGVYWPKDRHWESIQHE